MKDGQKLAPGDTKKFQVETARFQVVKAESSRQSDCLVTGISLRERERAKVASQLLPGHLFSAYMLKKILHLSKK